MANVNDGRITEAELIVPALRIMKIRGGYVTTTDLISELIVTLNPIGKDVEIIPGRQDTYFSQKVRNLKSHKKSPGNIIYEEYAEDVTRGLRITAKGLAYLNRHGN